jgi:hypothetical protein
MIAILLSVIVGLLQIDEPSSAMVVARTPPRLERLQGRCEAAIPTGAAVCDGAPVAFAALADDGRKLAAAREHDAAAQAAPAIPAPTPLAHLPGRVVFRSVASNQ